MANGEQELAIKIVLQHFGVIPSTVASILLDRNGSTLEDVYRSFKPLVEFWKVRNSLITLVQHNAVRVAVDDSEGDSQSTPTNRVTRYYLDVHEVLARLRYAKFALMVEKSHGLHARMIAFQVLKMGRASMHDAIMCALQDPQSSVALSAEEDDNDYHDPFAFDSAALKAWKTSNACSQNVISQDDFEAIFVKMVTENIFRRVEPLTKQKALEEESQAASSRPSGINSHIDAIPSNAKGKAKAKPKPTPRGRRKGNSDDHQPSTKRVRLAGVDVAGLPAGIVDSDLFGGHENDSSRLSGKAKNSKEDKEKLKLLIADFKSQNAVFCVNTSYLSLEICKQTIEDLLSTRFAQSTVVRLTTRILLSKVRKLGNEVVCEIQPKIEELAAAEGTTNNISKNHLMLILEALARHDDKIVRSINRADTTRAYTIDWSQATNVVRRRICFNAVHSRFGEDCARVWSYMTLSESLQGNDTKLWEDQQLAETVLTSPQIVRNNLYNLCRKGLCRLQISDGSSSSQSAASSTSSSFRQRALLFSSNHELSCNQVRLDLHETALRLWARKDAENLRIFKFYLRVQTLSEEEETELRARERGEDMIELSLLKLDNTLLLMRQF